MNNSVEIQIADPPMQRVDPDIGHIRDEAHSIICATWLSEALKSPGSLNDLVSRAETIIRGKLPTLNFHCIALSGVSGMLVGSVLAQRLDRRIIVVRKRKEFRHSSLIVEGLRAIEGVEKFRYIIVDDFMSSGWTVRRMQYEIALACRAECVGGYFFRDKEFVSNLRTFTAKEAESYDESKAKESGWC